MDLEKLAKMANQIAANNSYGNDEAKIAAVVADHLSRFWTPVMRAEIVEGHARKRVNLSPAAARAVEALAQRSAGAAAAKAQ